MSYNFPFFSSPWRLVLCFRYSSCQFWRVFLYSYVHRLVLFVRLICYCSFRGKRILQISQFSCCRLLPKKTVAVPFTVTLNVFITFRGQFRVMFNDWLYLYIYTYILALFLPTVRYLSFRAFFGMCVRFYIYIYTSCSVSYIYFSMGYSFPVTERSRSNILAKKTVAVLSLLTYFSSLHIAN